MLLRSGFRERLARFVKHIADPPRSRSRTTCCRSVDTNIDLGQVTIILKKGTVRTCSVVHKRASATVKPPVAPIRKYFLVVRPRLTYQFIHRKYFLVARPRLTYQFIHRKHFLVVRPRLTYQFIHLTNDIIQPTLYPCENTSALKRPLHGTL